MTTALTQRQYAKGPQVPEPAVGLGKERTSQRRTFKPRRQSGASRKKGRPRPHTGFSLEKIREDEDCRLVAEVYQNDVVIRVKPRGVSQKIARLITPKYMNDSLLAAQRSLTRGHVKGFSQDSRRRLLFLLRNTRGLWTGFLTLTYPQIAPRDGREIKSHINAFTQFLRRRKIAYVWVLEFQKRGAPHFHLFLSGFVHKSTISARWFEITGGSDRFGGARATRIEALRGDGKQAELYLAKYCGKDDDSKLVPPEFKNVGRFWGASRKITQVVDGIETTRQLLERQYHRVESVQYRELGRKLRPARKYMRAKFREWGFKWSWGGWGFQLRDGSKWFRAALRAAVLEDSGAPPWEDWDGVPPDRPEYLTPAEIEEKFPHGQFTFSGDVDASPLYPKSALKYRHVRAYQRDARPFLENSGSGTGE